MRGSLTGATRGWAAARIGLGHGQSWPPRSQPPRLEAGDPLPRSCRSARAVGLLPAWGGWFGLAWIARVAWAGPPPGSRDLPGVCICVCLCPFAGARRDRRTSLRPARAAGRLGGATCCGPAGGGASSFLARDTLGSLAKASKHSLPKGMLLNPPLPPGHMSKSVIVSTVLM